MAKKLLLLPLLLFFMFASNAQLKQKTVNKDGGTYIRSYHKNGKLAAEQFRATGTAKGYTRVFDKKGNEIYGKEISRFALISSVTLSYYPNGAVKTAEYSSHPDGGIQWWRETTNFDENGKITGTSKLSHEDLVRPDLEIEPVQEKLPDVLPSDTMKKVCDTLLPLDYGTYTDSTVDAMFTTWHRTEFNRICKANKIPKITCAGCTSVFAEVELEINPDGTVKKVNFIKGNACGTEMSDKLRFDISSSLLQLKFPLSHGSKCFTKRIGRVLKC